MKKFLNGIDWYLFFPYIILCGIGIVMVYSASAGMGMLHQGMAQSYLHKQILFVIISLMIVLGMSRCRFVYLKNITFLMVAILTMFFILIALFFWGKSINGASGWITLGSFSIQPAELCKFLFIVYFAHLFWKRRFLIAQNGALRTFLWPKKFYPLMFPVVMIGLIFIQPDTGGALINTFIILVMFGTTITSKRWLTLYSLLVMIGPLALYRIFKKPIGLFFANSHHYQFQRFVAVYNPFLHPQSSGQQLINSFYAISNGGLWGRGLGNSIQKMGYLAEPNTDFILPIISEELGLVAVIFVLGLLLMLIVRSIDIGFRSNNIYYSSICYGTAAYLFVQTLLNAGGSVGYIPLTGVALPFVSYGGSSIVTLSLCLGMVMSISRIEQHQGLL
ncbi:FtsW/RodA/SpoVE family cell cycle protein [Fructilactobacillus florum]|uniref:Probable peptidoglycan glycosyltransferase FtsW n=1 Tax=Fructilactobacillus florum DSM 22689 = JCM 16035 TaxID=1423745 RepID=A0A0R2CK62_9LACO|nr:FtsW/RodA/SpoVE family cell cycle protein [Fructilactobacillus florum]EKK20293.1 Cell division protein FtsW [Fructilactobacillus florum 2F]KRM91674.1 hypothetical protein FC87_GL000811 [Fructilactobacillus florum DSM 22689 = JCM 16035]